MYRHTQVGRFMLVLDVVLVVFVLVHVARGGSRAMLALAPLIVLLLVLFGSMTVEVDARTLRFRFGPGGWGKSIRRSDIASAIATRSHWLEGIGIRVTGRGMLYNVAAGPAVEVVLRDGKRFRVGTDEPDRLVAAIENEPTDE